MDKKLILIFFFAFIFLDCFLISAGTQFGFDSEMKQGFGFNEDTFNVYGNYSWNGNCENGGVEIKEDGIICVRELQVFNITSINVTQQNLTITEHLNILGNITSSYYFGDGSQLTGISTGKWNDSGSDIYYDTGNVGIGTTTPQSTLNINGGTGSLSTGLTFGDADTGIYEERDDRIAFNIGGALRLWMRTDVLQYAFPGGVTIRYTSSSVADPHYTFTSDINTGIGWAGADALSLIAGAQEGIRISETGGSINVDINGTLGLRDNDKFYLGTSNDISQTFDGDYKITAEVSSPDMIIDMNGGNVGIGTASPTSALSVSDGAISYHIDESDGFEAKNNANVKLRAYMTGGDGLMFMWDNDGNQNVRIHSDSYSFFNGGNVGIGTISPNVELHVKDSNADAYIRIESDTGYDTALIFSEDSTQRYMVGFDDSSDVFKISRTNFATTDFVLDSSGRVGIGTITPQNTLNVVGDLNVTGKLYLDTTSRAYAQTAYHNETDLLEISLSVEDQYENITGLHVDYNNSIYMNGQAIINKTAMYQLVGSISFSGGNSGLYRFNLFVNNLEEHACGSMRTTSSSELGSLSINCLVYLEIGDQVNIRVKDTTSPVQDVEITTLTFNMVEI